MVARGTGGVIVNVASISGIRTTNNRSCYGSSKAALNMLTMSLAHELGPKHVSQTTCTSLKLISDFKRRE